SPLDAGRCTAGAAEEFRTHHRGETDGRGLVSLLEPGAVDSRGTVRFSDHACQPLGEPIADAKFPPQQIRELSGFVVESGSRLLYVKPLTGTQTVLASHCTQWQWERDHLWFIEAGQLVVLDAQLNEVLRLGSQVLTWFRLKGFIWVVDGANLVVVDNAWQEVLRLEAWNGGLAISDSYTWVVANGQLVVLDAALKSTARLGAGVTEVVSLKDGQSVYVAGSQLYELKEPAKPTSTPLARDVCQVQSHDLGRWLTYRSPCSSQRLVVHDLDSQASQVYANGVTSVVALRPIANGKVAVMYETGGPGALTLWTQVQGEAPVEVARAESGQWGALAACPLVDTQTLMWGCGEETCKLIAWHNDGAAEDLAESVAKSTGSRILANFDGSVGELMVWTPLGSADSSEEGRVRCNLTRFASQVAPRLEYDSGNTALHPTHATAFILDSDGQTGTLAMTEPDFSFLATALPLPEPRRIAERVPIFGFEFLKTYAGLLYLSDFDVDSEVGTLRAWNLELGATSRVSQGVSEYVEYPEAGVVYAVHTGSRTGVWFAEFR
ncbi:hypothetical protein ACFL5O_10605, partial [Myxococcota bacterium]